MLRDIAFLVCLPLGFIDPFALSSVKTYSVPVDALFFTQITYRRIGPVRKQKLRALFFAADALLDF